MSVIRDLLPAGFTYKIGSVSGGITGAEPNSTMHQGRERLDWKFSPAFQLLSGPTRTLVFEATASVQAGDYLNEVWVTFDEFADRLYSWPAGAVKVMGAFQIGASNSDTAVSAEMWIGTDSFIVAQWDLKR